MANFFETQKNVQMKIKTLATQTKPHEKNRRGEIPKKKTKPSVKKTVTGMDILTCSSSVGDSPVFVYLAAY
jgi:hypothetical protein